MAHPHGHVMTCSRSFILMQPWSRKSKCICLSGLTVQSRSQPCPVQPCCGPGCLCASRHCCA